MDAIPFSVDERLQRLEAEVESLRRLVGRVEARLPESREPGDTALAASFPTHAEAVQPPGLETPAATDEEAGDHAGRELLGDLTLVGRTLMALGGAFLLRAVTETATLPDAAGVALGGVYGLLWLFLTHQAARRAPRSRSGTYHALTFTLVAFPLVTEAVLRFGVLAPEGAALALVLLAAAGLGVAALHGQRAAAWLTSLGTAAAAWVLLLATGRVVPFVLVLLVLGLVSLVLARRRSWPALPWMTAAAVDLALLVPLTRVVFDRWPGSPWTVVALQLAALVAYPATWLSSTRAPGWRPGIFVTAQTLALLVVGYGGAVRVALEEPVAVRGTGVAGLLLAVLCFTAAGALLRHRATRRSALLYFAAVGCPLLLGATALLLAPPVASLLWAGLGVLVGLAAVRLSSVTLALVGSVFCVAAATEAGVLRQGLVALALPATHSWPPLTTVGVVVLALVVVTAFLPFPQTSTFWRRGVTLPRTLLLAVATLGVAGTLLALLAPVLAGEPGPGADAGSLAALRTAVLAGLAVAAAGAGRWRRLREAGWMVYPLLGLGAVKLLVEDLPVGRPATLFAALAAYGAALVVAPRILRRPVPDTSGER